MIETKHCSVCKAEKPFDAFNRQRSARDGVKSRCRECQSSDNRARYAAKGEHIKDTVRAYASANADKVKAAKADRYQRNRETVLAQQRDYAARTLPQRTERRREYRLANPDKERAWAQSYRRANPHKNRARTSLRMARKKRATPTWANLDKVSAFYRSADALGMLTGEWYHVDHVVPLNGATVCGLHNEFNLQILTARENIAKSNRFWPDQP